MTRAGDGRAWARREFDAAGPYLGWALLVSFLSWSECALFPLGMPIWCIAWFVLARRSWLAALLSVLGGGYVALPAAGVVFGVLAYTSGEAGQWDYGCGSLGHSDLDPSTRTFARGGNDILVPGLDLLFLFPSSVMPGLVATVFGPPPHAYVGPYPTQREVVAEFDATAIPTKTTYDANSRDVTITAGNASIQVRAFVWSYEERAGLTDPCWLVRGDGWFAVLSCNSMGNGGVVSIYRADTMEPFVHYAEVADPALGAKLGLTCL